MLDTCYNYTIREGEEDYYVLVDDYELKEYHSDWYYSFKEEENSKYGY